MNNITPVVKQLLIINIIFFVGSQILGERAYEYFSLYYFENPNFKIWQPLTHMFMHAQVFMPNSAGNLSHIVFNMIGLVSFGSILENFWGGKRFLFYYLVCGFGAALVHTAVNYYYYHQVADVLFQNGYNTMQSLQNLQQGTNLEFNKLINELFTATDLSNYYQSYFVAAVGASGAIYGLLVAFAFILPNEKLAMFFIPIPLKAKYFIPAILVMDLFSGVTGFSIFGGGIAHFAHIGGALIGFLLMLLWRNKKFNFNRWN